VPVARTSAGFLVTRGGLLSGSAPLSASVGENTLTLLTVDGMSTISLISCDQSVSSWPEPDNLAGTDRTSQSFTSHAAL
jgi:hypothetical protein